MQNGLGNRHANCLKIYRGSQIKEGDHHSVQGGTPGKPRVGVSHW